MAIKINGIFIYYENISNTEKCDYTRYPHTIYHIMIINNGEKIKFNLMMINGEFLDIKFLELCESENESKYSETLIDPGLIKKFLEIQYTNMVRISVQDILSFSIYKDTKSKLKSVITFLNSVI